MACWDAHYTLSDSHPKRGSVPVTPTSTFPAPATAGVTAFGGRAVTPEDVVWVYSMLLGLEPESVSVALTQARVNASVESL